MSAYDYLRLVWIPGGCSKELSFYSNISGTSFLCAFELGTEQILVWLEVDLSMI